MRIEVAILEDDNEVRACLETFVAASTTCVCRRSFDTGELAVRELSKSPVDVVLVDLQLPGINGTQVIRKLKRSAPSMKSVILTVYEDDERIFDALAAGADGYILKRSSPDDIINAIVEVQRGGAPMSGIIARKVIQHFRSTDTAKPNSDLETLSDRENEVLALLARGDLYREIATKLGISYETVHTHIRRIYEKLHVRSRTQAVSKFMTERSSNSIGESSR